ncbi:MAG: phage portal protein [Ruminococcus flavefaciens]|nr:phage portal protein [Ruminococcus flavefaciens]
MFKIGLFRRKKKQEIRADTPSGAETSILTFFGITGELTREAAISIPTVSACINKIGDTISQLPVKLYKRDEEEVTEIYDDPRIKLLNGNTGDTLSTVDMWKAAIEDYYLGGGAWIYVNSDGLNTKSLNYVDSTNVSYLCNQDPIFKAFRVQINAVTYYDFQFIKLLRKTRDGYTNIPLQKEASAILSAAWNSLKLENMMNSNGGCKPGFLKSKNRLSDAAIASIKEGYARVYDNEDNREKILVLNDGIDFEAISSTAAELQMNENKKTNSIEICKLFGFPHTVIDGGATEDDNKKFIAAVISIINQIETELDNVLLLESEKEQGYYWAFDTKELTRGSLKERYDAYEIAVRNNILQVDEIRREEDYEPLGFNFIKLGLQDVLLNPETMDVFTPNTGQTKNLKTGEERADGMELREYIQLPNGKMNGSTGGNNGGKSGDSSKSGGKSAKKVDKTEKSDIIDFEKNKKELEKAIADGKIVTKLDKKAQLAHKKDSAEYLKRIAEGRMPSYTEMSNMEIQKIINTYSLTGKVRKGQDGQFRETISLKENIGMFGDLRTGKYIPTHRATIHYSKKGTHLVPSAPIEGD